MWKAKLVVLTFHRPYADCRCGLPARVAEIKYKKGAVPWRTRRYPTWWWTLLLQRVSRNLRTSGRFPQRNHGLASQTKTNSVDPCAARRDSRVCGGRGSASHARARGVRGELRPGQPAFDQRSL